MNNQSNLSSVDGSLISGPVSTKNRTTPSISVGLCVIQMMFFEGQRWQNHGPNHVSTLPSLPYTQGEISDAVFPVPEMMCHTARDDIHIWHEHPLPAKMSVQSESWKVSVLWKWARRPRSCLQLLQFGCYKPFTISHQQEL